MELRFSIFLIFSISIHDIILHSSKLYKTISPFIRTLTAFFSQVFYIFYFFLANFTVTISFFNMKQRSPSAVVFWITFHFAFWVTLQTLCLCIRFHFIGLKSSFCTGLSLRMTLVEKYLSVQERWYFTFNLGSFSSKGTNLLCSASSRSFLALIINLILFLNLFWDSCSFLLQSAS